MSTTDEVLAAARHLVQAFGRHDTAAYFDCFSPDATFIFHTAPARLASRAEYQQLWRQWEDEDEFRVLSCASAQPVVQDLGEAGVFSHDVTTMGGRPSKPESGNGLMPPRILLGYFIAWCLLVAVR